MRTETKQRLTINGDVDNVWKFFQMIGNISFFIVPTFEEFYQPPETSSEYYRLHIVRCHQGTVIVFLMHVPE